MEEKQEEKPTKITNFGECLICGEPITVRILLPCNHTNFCVKCYETLALCYNERKCPFCQKEVTQDPIITHAPELESYEKESQKRRQHDPNYHVYFDDRSDIALVAGFRRITCHDCNALCTSFGALKNHAAKEHKKQVCKICFDSKRFLPCDTELYTKNQFREHMKLHPTCPCCPYVAFDHDTLTAHLRENHFRCDICAAAGKIVWFATLELIEVHFHEEHYACENPLCVMQGFIVFATKMELLMHQVNVHGADPSILDDVKDDKDVSTDPEVEVSPEEVRKKRSDAKRRLKAALRREFGDDKAKISNIEDLCYKVDHKRMSVGKFCDIYNKVAGEAASRLFVEVCAAIFTPDIRAKVVKELQGIRGCTVPRSLSFEVDYPSLTPAQTPAPPSPQYHPPRNDRRNKKPKRVVLTNF